MAGRDVKLDPEKVLALSKMLYEERLKEVLDQGVNLQDLVGACTQKLAPGLESILTELAPAALTVEEFLNVTTKSGAQEALQRLALCARCPETGGKCWEKLREGEKPAWSFDVRGTGKQGIEWGLCDRWLGHLLDRKMLASGFPRLFLRCSVSSYVPRDDWQHTARSDLAKYVTDFTKLLTSNAPCSLILWSAAPAGKTQLAVAVCRALLEAKRAKTACFWSVSKLLEKLRMADDDERKVIYQQAMESHLLVLDRLGSHSTTDWVREQITMLIDDRWSNRMPIIVTTDKRLDVIKDSIGACAASRLESGSLFVNLSDPGPEEESVPEIPGPANG